MRGARVALLGGVDGVESVVPQPCSQGSLLSCPGKTGTRSRSPSLTRRIAASGNEIGGPSEGDLLCSTLFPGSLSWLSCHSQSQPKSQWRDPGNEVVRFKHK